MSLTIILSIIIIILIMAMVLNQKFMKDRVETEEYARNQLISKNSILSEENLSLKNQMLSTNNDVGQHAFKNAKRELRKILNRFKKRVVYDHIQLFLRVIWLLNIPFSNMHVHSILLSLLMLV